MALVFYKKRTEYYFLIIWLAVSTILIYTPFLVRFQRKLGEGLHIPIIIVGFLGLQWFVNEVTLKWRIPKKAFYGFFIVYFSLTNMQILWNDIKIYSTETAPYYLSISQYRAIEWLKKNTDINQSILSGYNISNLIPGVAGRTVYLGHYDQTINFNEKYDLAQRIIASHPKHGDPLEFFATDNGIDYIVVDEEVRSWGNYPVSSRPYLTLVYSDADVEIYKVQ
jgi:hypothetical protein